MNISGSLQSKGGIYYAVIRIPTMDGGIKQKWRTTKIPVDGKTKRGYSSNLKKANKFLQNLILEYENKATYESDKLFVVWLEEWLERKRKEVRLNTYESYALYVKVHLKPYFEPLKLKIDKVTPRIIQRYIDEKSASGQSTKSIQKHLVVLKGVFNEALNFDVIKYNPCDRVRLPKMEFHEGRAYSSEQATMLLTCISGDPLETAIMIGLYLGLRRSEVLGLRWQDVDFDNNVVKIRNTVVKTMTIVEDEHTKSRASKRDLYLMPNLKDYLLQWKRKQEDMQLLLQDSYKDTGNQVVHVCTRINGEPLSPDYVSKHFAKLLERKKLPKITFHELRHTCGSMLINAGRSVKEVQEYLGHEKASTTLDIYAHLTADKKVETGNCLNKLLNGDAN